VKLELRSLTAIAALLLPPIAAGSAPTADSPILRVTEDSASPVFFSIPKYALSRQEQETIAACLILEAASQGEYGMRAVMAVIRNRARGMPELFAHTVLREKQFSAMNNVTSGRESLWRTVQRAKRDRMWPVALSVVREAVNEPWHDPTGGATHYTRSVERTPWTRRLAKTVTIGAHSFYR
jgi:spore germination cell wall hydrolase CwlJ-like protein